MPYKRGFKPLNRVEYNEVNLDQLAERFEANAEVTPESLAAVGLVSEPKRPVVILGRGEIAIPLKVKVHRISKSARAKIEAAGGSVELIA